MLKDLNSEEKEILRKLHKKRSKKKNKEYKRRYIQKYPEKEKCKQRIKYLIKIGRIKKKPCIYCGNENSEVHHDDYNEPENVEWVCHKCHMKIYHVRKI